MTKPTLRQITARTQARAAQAERAAMIEEAVRSAVPRWALKGLAGALAGGEPMWATGYLAKIRGEFHRIQNQRAAKPKG